MTRYEELCTVFFEKEPSMVAIDTMLRELPTKMREALSTYLAAPTDKSPVASLEQPTRYVDLYVPILSQTGEKSWALCAEGNSLIKGGDGTYHFCAGIYLEKQPTSFSNFLMIYILFTVTNFDENSVELMIENCDDKIRIANTREPCGYMSAAQQTIDAILNNAKSPVNKHNIGFLPLR